MWEDPYINKCASVIYNFSGQKKRSGPPDGSPQRIELMVIKKEFLFLEHRNDVISISYASIGTFAVTFEAQSLQCHAD